MKNIDVYRRRRARVIATMAARGGGVAVLPTAPQAMRNRDSEYPYRHDSQFYYLSAFPEPDAMLVLVAAGADARSLLFCRPRDPKREVWDGFVCGPERAHGQFGFDAAHPIEELDARMPDLLADAPALFLPLGSHDGIQARAQSWLARLRARARSGHRAPASLHDLNPIIDEMRLVKDDEEIGAMRMAARISAQAHVRAMQACRPGWREYQLEAELLHEFRRCGAEGPAYTSIVAAGANACVLHYRAAYGELRNGELCLIDAGCEYDSYAADLTRTFPVNGRFTGAHRAVYEVVLAAQRAAIGSVAAGQPFDAPHETACRVLAQGLVDLGALSGSVDGLIESEALRQFYMHRTSHWLGLDVHDVGDYREPDSTATDGAQRPARRLAAGMVLTVEPGLYLRPAPNVPAALHHIGVRIEDDVLVTAGGCEVLTAAAPKEIDAIETTMREHRGADDR
jgi:Xaa-Pro aminopeptidase